MKNNSYKIQIGIIGVGVVGGQAKRWFELRKHPIFVYDRFKKIGSLEDTAKAKIIFLCLPTPHRRNREEGTDLSIFEEAAKLFKEPKIFVIKSTVPPGTTDKLQNKFKRHYFLHNPEFLTEATAWCDFWKPDMQVVGYTTRSKKFARPLLKILPKAKLSFMTPAVASETFKLARNAFFAVKVIFANEIYDLCQLLHIDYEKIRQLMSAEKWIGAHHLLVHHKRYRGFGGKCLPKDLKTFMKIYKNVGLKPELFEAVDRINARYIRKQGLMHLLNSSWLENHNET